MMPSNSQVEELGNMLWDLVLEEHPLKREDFHGLARVAFDHVARQIMPIHTGFLYANPYPDGSDDAKRFAGEHEPVWPVTLIPAGESGEGSAP